MSTLPDRWIRWTRPWRELAALPRPLWLLFCSTLINRIGTMALPFLVIYLTRHRGLSAGRAAFVMGLYGAGALIVKPYGGWLSDRYGAIPVMLFSLFSSGTLLLAYPYARSFWLISCLTLLWALLNEIFRPASMSATGTLAPPEQRKSGFVLNRLAVNLGMGLGPAVGGLLAQTSFPALFWVDGLTSVIAAGVIWRNFPQDRRPQIRAAQQTESVLSSFRGCLADPRLRYFAFALIPVSMVFFQNQSSMSLFLVRDLGIPASRYGLLFSINALMIITLEIPLNSATAHWPRRRSMVLGSILFAVGFGALSLARTVEQVAPTVIVWTFGEMLLFAGFSTYVADIAPPARRGSYMAVYLTALGVAFLIGPWLGIQTLDLFGARALWTSCLLLGLLSALMMWRNPWDAKPCDRLSPVESLNFQPCRTAEAVA